MSIICDISGHKWYFSGDDSKCRRCGTLCKHEKQIPISKCNSRCQICNNVLNFHQWVSVSEDGRKRCAKCGEESVDWSIRSNYIRMKKEEERKQKEREAQEKEARLIDRYMCSDGRFRCMVCNEIKPTESMSKTYNRPVCMGCARKLKEHFGHVIFEKQSGYETERICIKCLRSEEYKDAELQGGLLQDQPCKL